MAGKVVGSVLDYSQATLGTRLVLIAIAESANHETRECWPSIAYLMRAARLSEAAVHRALKKLIALGEIEVTARSGSSNIYRVTDYGGVASETGGVSPATPRTVSEPLMNRQKRESASRTRGWRRVPPTEQLTEDRRRMAWETNNLTRDVAAKEWAAMKDYEFPNPHADVDATWRNWCRKVRAPLRPPPPAPGKRTEMRAASPSDSGPVRMGKIFERVVPSAKETRTRFVDEDRRLAEEDVGL